MTRLIRLTLPAALLSLTLLAGGCSNTISSSDLRANWTPELYSVAEGHEEHYNNRSIHVDNTWRQIHDDWSMIWLQNRNLRMTRYNLP